MTILQRLARLLDVKSLVTLALVLVLCIMTLSEREVSELFGSSVMLVLGFFFGKNVPRDNQESVNRESINQENNNTGKMHTDMQKEV